MTRAARAALGGLLALALLLGGCSSGGGDDTPEPDAPQTLPQVTLQPLERYALDAAILFSDILTVPDAMGLGLYFEEGEGPRFRKPVRTEADVRALGVPDPEAGGRLVFRSQAELDAHLAGLEKEMRTAATNLDFERAASLRDQVRSLRTRDLGLGTPTRP